MVIDFHTHCFPDKLAERATRILSHKSGGLIPQTDGSLGGLKKIMKESGVSVACVMNIATNAKQMQAVNDFANEINGENIVAFGSVFPDAENWEEELERISGMGLKGVKFHPDYQGFYVDDPKMKPIYKKISSLGLITLFHAGFDYGFPPPYHCMPENLARALSWFDSPVVAAHWGGLDCGILVYDKLCGLPLYFDTSFGYGSMPAAIQKMIIEKHGADKILFGSDCPWHNPAWDIRNLEHLELTEAELSKIYYKNAEKMLGFDESSSDTQLKTLD